MFRNFLFVCKFESTSSSLQIISPPPNPKRKKKLPRKIHSTKILPGGFRRLTTKGMSNSIVLKQALFRSRELIVIVAALDRSSSGPSGKKSKRKEVRESCSVCPAIADGR